MLADPRRSCIVLINPARLQHPDPLGRGGGCQQDSVALLPDALEAFGMPTFALGECDPSRPECQATGLSLIPGVDIVSFWQDPAFTSVAAGEGGFVFLGGGWLEEDILIASLEGARLGYDVRLLTDISATRIERDRHLALDRLAMHGALPTTIRQAMLEWAFCVGDAGVRQRIQALLAQEGRRSGLS